MSSNNDKVLVMQVSGDTALLLCHGGKFIRTKLKDGMKVGVEMDAFGLEEIDTLSMESKGRPIRRIMIQVACVMLLVTGVFALMAMPIKNYFESNSDKTGNKAVSISGVIESVKRAVSKMYDEETSDILEEPVIEQDNLANTEETKDSVHQDENVESDNTGNKQDEPNEVIDEDSDEETSTQETEEGSKESSNTLDPELSLAKELFGYEVSRNEYYSLGTSGHVANPNEIVVTDDIYIPFWGINMEFQEWQIPNTIDLSFTYSSIDEIPNFDKATVYLYDLTEQKEVVSEIKDNMEGNYEDIDGVKLANAYSTLYVDSSLMMDNHTYYIKINNVTKDGVEIDNIYYVFDYISGGSLGFRYED